MHMAEKKSGLRRRGHLLRGLRTLVIDPKTSAKQRLEACKMLFELETTTRRDDEGLRISPRNQEQFQKILAAMERNPFNAR
jgi:hypothetical protein